MGLKFSPKLGQIIICDYSTGFREPEMVKKRLAVVVSPRLPNRDGLCTVVPLSTSPSRTGIRYQCRIELPFPAPMPYEGAIKWAKCDLIATLSYHRMSLPYTARDHVTGKRNYIQMVLPADEMSRIRHAILNALGLES